MGPTGIARDLDGSTTWPMSLCSSTFGEVGAFDFSAWAKWRAHSWMQRRGTEWLSRLGNEPKRPVRRYVWGNPRFSESAAETPGSMPGRRHTKSSGVSKWK